MMSGNKIVCRADVVWVQGDGDDSSLELNLETRCGCPYCCKQYASLLMQAVMMLAADGQLDVNDIVKTACLDERTNAGHPVPH